MMLKRCLIVIPVLLIVVSAASIAQQIDIKKHPGYVDLDDIKIPDAAEEITDIDLGPALLALARLGADEDDEDFDKGLSGLLSIRVKSFKVDMEDTDEIRHVMKKIDKKLNDENWTPLIRSRSHDELTNVSMKIEDGKIVGFFLMSMDSDDGVSFVNIIGGNVDLESIKNFGLGISDSALDSLEKSLEKF
jgi:hypothetical protein